MSDLLDQQLQYRGSETTQAPYRAPNVPNSNTVAAGFQYPLVPDPVVEPSIPAYLSDTYYWAYIDPFNVRMLDREWVVSTILWGQHLRLQSAAFSEIAPGQHVLLPAAVYGQFVPNLARHITPLGFLQVSDVCPIQVAHCRDKLVNFPHAIVRQADARHPGAALFDVVCCYFLMHELPDDVKSSVIDVLLARLAPGGKLVCIDYHQPHWAHPAKLVTSLVFDWLEPFAKSLWFHEIRDFATQANEFSWSKSTYFGGLFQKVVARRLETIN